MIRKTTIRLTIRMMQEMTKTILRRHHGHQAEFPAFPMICNANAKRVSVPKLNGIPQGTVVAAGMRRQRAGSGPNNWR